MTTYTYHKPQKPEMSNDLTLISERHPCEYEQFNPARSEMALWTAVITQALMDAGSKSNKPEAQHEKAKAIRWLLGNSNDFVIVCQNAGLDPQSVRQKALAAIERGCIWRVKKSLPPQGNPSPLPLLQQKSCLPATSPRQDTPPPPPSSPSTPFPLPPIHAPTTSISHHY